MKRFVCFLLTVIMLVCMIPAANAVDTTLPFEDVKESHWWYEAVTYCYENNLLKGMSDVKFGPTVTLTRAMFVQALANFEGVDAADYADAEPTFTDVKPTHWYFAAVEWAKQNNITGGVSETKFAPNNALTREQMARLFHQYAIYKGLATDVEADISAFDDASKINSWALDGMKYCVGAGLFVGDNNKLTPGATANRAQLAVVLTKFHQLEPASYEGRIVFWGDSLTQGILTGFDDVVDVPYPERVGEILGCEIKNYGIGSEMAYQIASRQGGLPMYAYATEAEPFVIPADTTPVEICLYNEFVDEFYSKTNHVGVPEHDLYAGINPVSIGGILGEVKQIEGSNWSFTRLEAGEEAVFTDMPLVETFGMRDKREDDIVVIWIGHNDVPAADDEEKHNEIIEYIDAMIEYAGTEKFVVMGLMAERYCPGYAEINAKIAAHMEANGMGDKFLDIRTYLADPQHLVDLGIEPNTAPNTMDLEWIEKGWIPESLQAEKFSKQGYSLHLNQYGYDLVAHKLVETFTELGYLN